MELGLTFPLQRFLRIKTPAWGTEPGPGAFCWDPACHPPAGPRVPAGRPLPQPLRLWSAGMCPLLQREDIPGLFRAGLADSLTAAGLSPSRVEGYLEKAGPGLPHPHSWPREVAFLNRAWEDVLALDLCLDTERQAQPCWTAPSTPAPVGAQALRDWGQGWSGYPHRCYERDAGHPP